MTPGHGPDRLTKKQRTKQMTTFDDIKQDFLKLSKRDGINRTHDIELLEKLSQHSNINIIDTTMDFWDDGSDCVNSYNWNGPVVFEIRRMTDSITGISFHRAGDARCNYSDAVFIKCTVDELINIISEFPICRHIDGWHISQSYFSESGTIDAWCDETGTDYSGCVEMDNAAPDELLDAYKQTDLYC